MDPRHTQANKSMIRNWEFSWVGVGFMLIALLLGINGLVGEGEGGRGLTNDLVPCGTGAKKIGNGECYSTFTAGKTLL